MTGIQEPRVRVLIEQEGTDKFIQYDVQTDNRDRIRWDLIRERKGWPQAKDGASLWMTVMAWNALKRSGVDVGSDPEKWLNKIVGVYGIDAEGNLMKPEHAAGVTVDPTQQETDDGS